MAKFLTEVLYDINKDPNLIEKYKDDAALKFIFEYAFDPSKKFDLPAGDPPYKEDPAPLGMSPANLRMETKKFYVFQRKDVSNLRREQLFIGLLENVHPEEAKLLLAIKDQKLTKLYPKITRKLLEAVEILPKTVKAPKE